MSDTARLVEASRAGDRDALEMLYRLHQGRVLAFIRVVMGPGPHAGFGPEDVLQETLLESARKIAAFEPQGPGSFYRWLVAIARFKLSDARRAQRAGKRAAEVPLDAHPPDPGTSPSRRVMQGERDERIVDAMEALPERQRDAVRMRYLEGRSVAETAQALGVTEAAAKALVARGLIALAPALQSERTAAREGERAHREDDSSESAIPPTP